ncbi:MAG: class I SAM-dependent methyltransferase, partial [Candidatus Binatia bacterium]
MPCDLCGARDDATLFVASDFRYGTPDLFPVVRCRRCGLVRTDPRPAVGELERFYPTHYSAHRSDALQYQSRSGELLRRLALGRPTLVRSWAIAAYNSVAYRAILASPPGRLLDVGCGLGHYLEIWKSFGWEVEGLEPAPDAAAVAEKRLGVPVHVGSVESVSLPERRFDVVTLCHALEHVRSPRTALRSIRRSLVPEGRLLLMLPNFAAWDRRLFAPEWYAMEVPRHLFHFEPSTLRALLAAEGFRLESLGGSAHP